MITCTYHITRTFQALATQIAQVAAYDPNPGNCFGAFGLTYNAGASTTVAGPGDSLVTRNIVFDESPESIAIMGDVAARIAETREFWRAALSVHCKTHVVALTPVVT